MRKCGAMSPSRHMIGAENPVLVKVGAVEALPNTGQSMQINVKHMRLHHA